jgi:hypothetical protein
MLVTYWVVDWDSKEHRKAFLADIDKKYRNVPRSGGAGHRYRAYFLMSLPGGNSAFAHRASMATARDAGEAVALGLGSHESKFRWHIGDEDRREFEAGMAAAMPPPRGFS